jgi:hypothetical protein
MVHRIRGGYRGSLVDMNKGARALAGGIGNPCQAFLDQFARRGASGIEVSGECGKCRMSDMMAGLSLIGVSVRGISIGSANSGRPCASIANERHAAAGAPVITSQRGDAGRVARAAAFDNAGDAFTRARTCASSGG